MNTLYVPNTVLNASSAEKILFIPHKNSRCCSVTQWYQTLQPHGLQHARLPCPCLPEFAQLMSTELLMPSNHLILAPPSPPALNLSQHQGHFQ